MLLVLSREHTAAAAAAADLASAVTEELGLCARCVLDLAAVSAYLPQLLAPAVVLLVVVVVVVVVLATLISCGIADIAPLVSCRQRSTLNVLTTQPSTSPARDIPITAPIITTEAHRKHYPSTLAHTTRQLHPRAF